jgi:hypothetical protein
MGFYAMRMNLLRTGIVGLLLCGAMQAFAQPCTPLFSYDSLVIGEQGSGYALTSSNQGAFTATTDVTWLALSSHGSSITVTAAQSNETPNLRTGHIIVTQSGTCTETIAVVQPGITCLRGIDGTQGRKFWAAFMENRYPNSPKTPLTTDLVFASLTEASGTITNPNTGWSKTFTAPAKGIRTIAIPEAEAYNTEGEVINNKAVYIETSVDVSVYAVNFQYTTSDAAVILPAEALGDEYYSLSFNGNVGQSGPDITDDDRTPEEFLIVATENNTLVTIVPASETGGGKPAGNPYTIRLYKGQSYLVKSDTTGAIDNESNYVSITGSYIKSNKLIAVFGGHKRAHVGCNGNNSRDHLYEQLLPLRLWGTQYLVVPTNLSEDLYRILAAHDNTQFSIGGGTSYTLNRGEYKDFLINQNETAFIDANHPISVALFAESMNCTHLSIGDPFMIVLNPVQNMTKELTFSPIPLPPSTVTEIHYVNITVQKQSKALTRLVNEQTGAEVPVTFTDIPGRDYAYAKVPVQVATHSLKNEMGFTAYAYGAGNADSYGYLVGARFNHLQEPELVRDTSYCVDEPPQPLSVYDSNDLLWYTSDDFENETGSTVAPTITTESPKTYTLYVSYLKNCSESPRKKVTIIVENPPADPVISTPHSLSSASFCAGENDTLTAASAGAEVFDWYKDNQKIASVSSTTFTVTESGTYQARAATKYLCYAEQPSNLFEVTVHELPDAPVLSNTSVCKNDIIPAVPATPSGYTFLWYDETNQVTTEPTLQTGAIETTTYYISRKDNITNCEGPAATWVYTVNNLPDVTISGTSYFCKNSSTELTASGAVDYLWSNGAASASTTVNAVNTYNVTGTDQNGCKDTAEVTTTERPLPQVTANNDTVVCPEREVTLGTQYHIGALSWNSPQTVKVTGPQTYTVTASNECGSTSDSMAVDIFAPIRFTVPNPLPSYKYRKYYEQALSFENAAYPVYLRWLGTLPEGMTITADGILRGTPMITGYNFDSHRFTLFLEDNHGCAVSQEFVLTPLFYAPTAIIRDGGENSHFLPDFDLEIYNRQGILIHSGRGGLGTSGASQVSPGTYFYKVTLMQDGEQRQYMGYITVLQ